MFGHNVSEILRQLLEMASAEGIAVVAVVVVLALMLTGLEQLGGRWLAGLRSPFATWRQAPSSAATIASHQRKYRLLDEQAGGDVCDAPLATSGSTTYVLKIPRHAEASELLAKERDVLRMLVGHGCPAHYRQYLPELVESFEWGLRRVNAFKHRDGLYTAEEIRLSHPHGVDGRHLGWMLNRTLEVLGYVHQRGWLHGAVLPPHLLFDVANHGLVLVDWIHAQRIDEPLVIVPERFQPWYPSECFRREGASEATDIYLAARSMIFLAGGDPLAAALPPHIPEEMAELLGQCLHVSPRARPHDAWRLRDQFAELLRRLYGPPQFHVLAMH